MTKPKVEGTSDRLKDEAVLKIVDRLIRAEHDELDILSFEAIAADVRSGERSLRTVLDDCRNGQEPQPGQIGLPTGADIANAIEFLGGVAGVVQLLAWIFTLSSQIWKDAKKSLTVSQLATAILDDWEARGREKQQEIPPEYRRALEALRATPEDEFAN